MFEVEVVGVALPTCAGSSEHLGHPTGTAREHPAGGRTLLVDQPTRTRGDDRGRDIDGRRVVLALNSSHPVAGRSAGQQRVDLNPVGGTFDGQLTRQAR